ncbi:MAG: VIT domain-containing protein [Candidatus Sumerlaeales bacterium]|nr:VIT domain-containing protein [Candidatus Sumerlaeales bacterium]
MFHKIRHVSLNLFSLLCLTTGVFLSASSANAIIIIPRPPMPIPMPSPIQKLELGETSITSTIKSDVARTRIYQSFYNPNKSRLEADVYIPVPVDAGITDFSVTINGKMQKGEVLESNKARKIYEGIVREMRDPGLLEFTEQGLAHIRLFPVEPKSSMSFECELMQKLNADQGANCLRIPIKVSDKMFRSQSKGVSIQVSLLPNADGQYRNIYSPTHRIDINQPDAKDKPVVVTVKQIDKEEKKNADFILYYEKDNKDFAMSLLSEFDLNSTQGTFMMVIDPPVSDKEKEEPADAQDVVFVLDTSGSMSGEKIEQAKNAINQCIAILRPQDRFAAINFASSVDGWNNYMLASADKDNKKRATSWIDGLEACGGTNISGSLEKALTLRANETSPSEQQRMLTVIFLTDGQPTVGTCDVKEILEELSKKNSSNLRIFTFGIGYDVNTRLLDGIADATRAAVEYVRPEENMEVPVSRLFGKVSRPALTNLSLKIEGAGTSQLYPPNLPDLLYGTQLTVIGRYDKPTTATMTLTGKRKGKEETHTFKKEFADKSNLGKTGFLEKLWATRKVGWLSQQIRSGNNSQELKDELIALGTKYNIATPFSSMLVAEDTKEQQHSYNSFRPATLNRKRHGTSALESAISVSKSMDSGVNAVNASVAQKSMSTSDRIQETDRYISEQEYQVDASTTLRLNSDRIWVDTALSDSDKATIVIKYMSDAWFMAAELQPKIKTAFAAGEKLRFKLSNGTILEVAPDKGLEQLTDADKAALSAN